MDVYARDVRERGVPERQLVQERAPEPQGGSSPLRRAAGHETSLLAEQHRRVDGDFNPALVNFDFFEVVTTRAGFRTGRSPLPSVSGTFDDVCKAFGFRLPDCGTLDLGPDVPDMLTRWALLIATGERMVDPRQPPVVARPPAAASSSSLPWRSSRSLSVQTPPTVAPSVPWSPPSDWWMLHEDRATELGAALAARPLRLFALVGEVNDSLEADAKPLALWGLDDRLSPRMGTALWWVVVDDPLNAMHMALVSDSLEDAARTMVAHG
jgi:hypothetical protein